MKPLLILLAGLAMTLLAHAQVPPVLSYQGQVTVDGTNFTGNAAFKFALVNQAGNVTFWSNDGTSAAGGEPAAGVSLAVDNGIYSIALGDVTLANMQAVPSSVFSNSNVRLRIWFDDGVHGSQLLTPDQRVLSVGYAMMSAHVPDGSITESKLANGSVTSGKIGANAIGASQIATGAVNSSDVADNSITSTDIADGTVSSADIADGTITGADIALLTITSANMADNSITSGKLVDDLDLGSTNANGRLDIYNTIPDTPAITLDGIGNRISIYGDDGAERGRLWGTSYGELFLNDSLGNNMAARLTANNNNGGRLYLYNSNGFTRALVSGENQGGVITLYQADGSGTGASLDGNNSNGAGELNLYQGDGALGAVLYGDDGNGSGALSLRNTAGNPRLRLYGGPNAGSLALYNNAGELNVHLWSYSGEEGTVSVRNKFGNETIYLWGRDGADVNGGQIGMKEADGTETLTLQASEVANGGAQIVLRKSDGTATITLDADQGGDGRITTQILQITGGSDLSEQFEINSAAETLEPGMLVSIDPANPGRLVLSRTAYDRTAAGVISGAGGVNPGMVMGQTGTIADGKYPVALTGRVYCRVDAGYGAVQPGDLITTSDTPGHGMKVKNHGKAQGAIIGKAMTGLKSGKGLVLVLVSLQ